MKPFASVSRLLPFVLFAASVFSQADQELRYNYEYHCNKERIVIGHCRKDSDMPGFAPTKPEDDYCQVYYPDRPKTGGFEAMGVVLRADIIKTLEACGALRQEEPVSQASDGDADYSNTEFKTGKEYYDAKDYAKAAEHFKKAADMDHSSFAAYLYLGMTHYNLKQYPKAIDAIKVTISMTPTMPEAHYWLGVSYAGLDQYTSAESELREAIRLNADYQGAYEWLGVALSKQKKYPDAIRSFQQALRLKPDDDAVIYSMGLTYARMGQKENAMQVYRTLQTMNQSYAQSLLVEINTAASGTTAALKPGTAEYYLTEGNKYRDKEDYTRAVEEYKKALAIKPASSAGQLNLGVCYYQLKQYQAALSPLQQAVRLDANDADSQFWLGVTYYRLKQYPSAKTTLLEAIRLDPKSPFSYHNLGDVYLYGFAQYDKAEEEYRETIRLKPDYDLAHNQLGLAYLWQNQYPNALAEFQTAFRLKGNDPESSPTYLENIGIAYVRLGKKDEAMKIYQTLQKTDVAKAKILLDLINDPDSNDNSVTAAKPSAQTVAGADALVAKATAYYDAKDYAKAIETCKKAIALDPKNPEANFYLAMSYDQSEQWEAAVLAWNRYIPLVKPWPNEFILLGDAHRELKHYDEALKTYKKALDLKPDAKKASGINYWIGVTYKEMKQYDKAVTPFLESIRLDPNFEHPRTELGQSYMFLGRDDEAIASFKEAIRLNPNDKEAHYYLGLAYVVTDKKAEAMQEYKKLQIIDQKWAQDLLTEINKP